MVPKAKATRRVLLAACTAVLATAAGASAAIQTWNGGGADDNWTTSGNWLGGTALIANDALLFDGSVRLTPNNNIAAGTAFTGIGFTAAAGAFMLSGNQITLSGDITDDASGQVQTINLGLALDANRTARVTDSAFVTLNGVVSGAGFGITKTGNGTLTLGASNTYTGDTVLAGGTLVYGADNSAMAALNMGIAPAAGVGSTDVSTLDLSNANVTAKSFRGQINNATASTVNIGTGKTLTVNGEFTVGMPSAYTNQGGVQTRLTMTGGGSLVVNSVANLFRIGLSRPNAAPASGTDPFSTLDLSGLSNFTFSGTNHFRVGNGNSRGELTLAGTSNTITASQVRVGDSGPDAGGTGGGENNNGGDGILRLGAGSNVINTDTFIIGRTKSRGIVQFLTTTGTLTIAGSAGGTSKSNITIGSSDTGNGSGAASQLFLAGHDVAVQGGIVVVGQRAGGQGGSAKGQVTFDTGTFSADSLRFAVNSSGTGTTATEGTFTLGGVAPGSGATGVLNVANEFFLTQRTNGANPGAGPSTGTFNINGGTANINADIADASTSVGSLANTTTINMQGGTLNLMNHAIGSVAAPLTTINLSGGTVKDVTLLAGKAITLGSGLILNASPSYFVDNSQFSGILDASGFGTLNIATGKSLRGGGSVSGNVVAASDSRIVPGTAATVDTLNFQNNLTLGNNTSTSFRLSENAGSGNDQINVAGTLDVSAGVVKLELDTAGAGPKSGNVYNLINYTGGLNGNQTNFTLAPSATLADSRLTFILLPTTPAPGVVQVSVGGAGALDLQWVGNISNKWVLKADANWRDTVQQLPQQFFALDKVIFDDSSTNANAVEVVGQVRPGLITVDAVRNYTLGGAGEITGGGSLTKRNSGTLTIAAATSYGGPTTIESGTVIFTGNSSNTGAMNILFGATAQVGAGGGSGSLGVQQVNNDGVLNFNRSDALAVAATISGGGQVRHSGSGTTTLSGVSNYVGPTNILAGTLRVTDETSLGDVLGGDVTISDGAALDVSGSTAANGINFGTKRFLITGSGVGGTGVLTNGGTVGQQNAFQRVILTGDATVGGTGRFDIRGNGSALDLAFHTLTKTGTGQFTLVGTNVSEGNIAVNQGIFSMETTTRIQPTGSNSTITYNAGTTAQFFNVAPDPSEGPIISRPMILNGGVTMGNSSAANQPSTIGSPITLNGDMTVTNINNSAGALTLVGVISETGGARSLIKNGPTTLTLSGENTYSGLTQVNAGTLRVTNTTGSATGSGAVSLAGGATLTGSGIISGTVTASANSHIAPGDAAIGSLTLRGLSLAGGSNLDFEGSGNTFDLLNVTNSNGLTFSGNANLNFAPDSSFTAGDYTLIDYAGTPIGNLNGKLTLSTSTFGDLQASLVDDAASTSIKLHLAPVVQGQPGWNVDSDGSWGVAGNWTTNSVPDASNATASFLGKITAPRTVTLDGSRTVQSLNFDNASQYTIAAGTGGTLTVGDGTSGSIAVTSGTHEISAGLAFAGSVTKSGPGTLVISGAQSHGAGAALIVSGGTVNMNSNPGTPNSAAGSNLSLSVTGSRITLGSDIDVKELTLDIGAAGSQTLDLNSPAGAGQFHVVRVYAADLNAAKSALFSAIANANKAGAADPQDGIIDSTKHAGAAIGIASLGDHITIRATRVGDLNLDGSVTISDFIDLAANFNGTNKTWQDGDLNYDGSVTISDFIDLASNFNSSYAGSFGPISAGDQLTLASFASSVGVDPSIIGSAVPEPGSLSLLAIGVVGLLRRRQRKA